MHYTPPKLRDEPLQPIISLFRQAITFHIKEPCASLWASLDVLYLVAFPSVACGLVMDGRVEVTVGARTDEPQQQFVARCNYAFVLALQRHHFRTSEDTQFGVPAQLVSNVRTG